jgi:two-component system chemotaxis response regulator CheB
MASQSSMAAQPSPRAPILSEPWPELIAIGGSTGAIEALNGILPALPAGFPVPIVAVVHIPRDRRSLLAEIFQDRCALSVREAEDKQPLEPGTVSFAPPDYHLLVESNGRLALSVDPTVNGSRPSIDVLFESAAWAFQRRLLAIVLGGASRDGVDGLAQVRRCGGRGWVVDPAAAVAPLLPRSAIDEVGADRVLSVEAIAEGLRTLHAANGGQAVPA